MHMSGFVFGAADCVVFLLTTWKVDSALKMNVAVLASTALGLLYETLTWLRRAKLQSNAWLLQRTGLWRGTLASLYMLQVRNGP